MSPSDQGQSATRRKLVEAQLLEHATLLFAERGVGAVSLEDVAQSMGMRRPSLYHYVDSKEDLLARIVGNFAAGGEGVVTHAIEQDWDPATKLRAITRGLCLEVAAAPARFRLMASNEANLPSTVAARLRASKRAVTRGVTDVIAEGIDRGDFRPCDPLLAALAILGMCNWLAWWFEPGSDHPPEPVAEAFAEQAVRSVLPAEGQARHGGDPAVVLDALRDNVETLAQMIDQRRQPRTKSSNFRRTS
jgi:AcrR family transcriptional regulator